MPEAAMPKKVYHDLRIDLNFDAPMDAEEVMERVGRALQAEFEDDVVKFDGTEAGMQKIELPLGFEGIQIESEVWPDGQLRYHIRHPQGMEVCWEEDQFTTLRLR